MNKFYRLNSKFLPAFHNSLTPKVSNFKVGLFFMFISMANTVTILSHLNGNNILQPFLSGLILGPLLVWIFALKNGPYGLCILLIFLSELGTLNSFFSCASITASLLVCPFLIYYLTESSMFMYRLSQASSFIPLGSLVVLFVIENNITLPGAYATLNYSTPLTVTLLLLVSSFFLIFSAWQHRLCLLKNK
jgi:hypothetical protein